jgi:hypothetical protein
MHYFLPCPHSHDRAIIITTPLRILVVIPRLSFPTAALAATGRHTAGFDHSARRCHNTTWFCYDAASRGCPTYRWRTTSRRRSTYRWKRKHLVDERIHCRAVTPGAAHARCKDSLNGGPGRAVQEIHAVSTRLRKRQPLMTAGRRLVLHTDAHRDVDTTNIPMYDSLMKTVQANRARTLGGYVRYRASRGCIVS